MRFGIPLLADRVAPRCTHADSVLLVDTGRRRIDAQSVIPLEGTTWVDLAAVLADHQVQTLVCGGISPTTRESIQGRDVSVIDNVAGTSAEVLEALRKGRIHPGYGLDRKAPPPGDGTGRSNGDEDSRRTSEDEATGEASGESVFVDCLECTARPCLAGEVCPYLELPEPVPYSQELNAILDAAWDVALEEERALCRLAELVYFALEMGYARLGVAFCEDLREPASILTGVLRRFFEVIPVSCKLRAQDPMAEAEATGAAPKRMSLPEGGCNPETMAAFFNQRKTDLNVLVGLCVGADAVFQRSSQAPVTTLFAKDKSLANNPIGALYSHYHLSDI